MYLCIYIYVYITIIITVIIIVFTIVITIWIMCQRHVTGLAWPSSTPISWHADADKFVKTILGVCGMTLSHPNVGYGSKRIWSTRFWGMNWMSPHFPRPSHFPSYFGVSSSATCLTHTQMRDNLAGRGSQFQVGTERKNPSWRPRFPSQLVTSEGISAYVTLPSICAFNHLGLVIQHHPTMEDSKHGMSWHLSKEV